MVKVVEKLDAIENAMRKKLESRYDNVGFKVDQEHESLEITVSKGNKSAVVTLDPSNVNRLFDSNDAVDVAVELVLKAKLK